MSDFRENVKKSDQKSDSATRQLAERHMSDIRARLLLKQPFYGVLLSMTDFIPEDVIPTMATDGIRVFYNPEYVINLSEAERSGVLLHEISHCIYLHCSPDRRLNRDRMRWNFACFPAGTYIPGANKNIEELKTGDYVIGADGQRQKITNDMAREYSGDLYTINPMGILPFSLTSEHPVRVVSRDKKYPIKLSDPVWKEAKDINPEVDYLVIPAIEGKEEVSVLDISKYVNCNKTNGHDQCHNISKEIRDGIKLDKDFAWLMGIYTAEGSSISSQFTGIQFSLHADETEYRDKIIKFGSRYGYTPRFTVEDNKQQVYIYSTIMSKMFEEHVGRGSHNKRIPDFILFNKDLGILKSYLNGLFDGDGCQVSKNCKQLATVSLQLALQTQMAISRLGCFAKVRKNIVKERMIRDQVLSESYIYVVDWTTLVTTPRVMNGKKIESSSIRWKFDGQNFYTPIHDISVQKFNGTVYNLTTEDHTFTVSNALVHNCDYAINLEIKDLGYTLPKGVLLNDKFRDMNAEQIYDQLPKDEKELEKLGGTLDTHIEPADGSEDWDDMEDKVISAFEMTKDFYETKQNGKFPGGIKRWIAKLRRSKVKWERIFHRFVGEALAKDDFSYERCNRRLVGQDIYLPDLRNHIISQVILAIDTSGSITPKIIEQFAAELAKISHLVDEVIVMTCDAAVHEVVKVRKMEDFMKKIAFKGGWGTDFRPVFQEVAERKYSPELLVYLTDAWGTFPEKKPPYPVIWTLTKGANKSGIPWGSIVEMPEDSSSGGY